ncbi:MAG: hypothetical protein U1E10_16585 [Bdellovibrionales bacterium]|nr:hypothetical protein [Bdellovibrionales bacterium]
MSGSAGVVVLEEQVLYSYQESARRKLRPEDYHDYFQRRRDEMIGAIQLAQPQFNAWRKSVLAAGIKLKSVPVFAELDRDLESHIAIQLEGARGSTQLTVSLDGLHTAEQKEKLKQLSKSIEFEALYKRWSDAGSPAHNPMDFVRGAMDVRAFEKFTLAIAVTSTMRKQLQAGVIKELSARLDVLSKKAGPKFDEVVKSGEMWIDPSTLVSYKERFGSLPSGDELLNPAASKFNFFGPLFDGHGGRTSKSFGAVAVSMLFLSNSKNWETDSTFGKNRGSFEAWFGQLLQQ